MKHLILPLALILTLTTAANAVEEWEKNTYSYGYTTGGGGSPSALHGAADRALDDTARDYDNRVNTERQRDYDSWKEMWK